MAKKINAGSTLNVAVLATFSEGNSISNTT